MGFCFKRCLLSSALVCYWDNSHLHSPAETLRSDYASASSPRLIDLSKDGLHGCLLIDTIIHLPCFKPCRELCTMDLQRLRLIKLRGSTQHHEVSVAR